MKINRRHMLGSSLGGMFAFALRNRQDRLFAANPSGKSKRCIVLWMDGGPSQMDTFDLKPGTNTGGELKPIATASADIRISETLPGIAKHMDTLSVIRNLTSKEGDHGRGNYYMHTGFTPIPSFPRPTAGSVISRYSAESEIPKFVALGGNGFGPAFMGPDHAPFTIDNPGQAKELLDDLRRRRNRLGLLDRLSTNFDEQHDDAMVERRCSMVTRIERLVTTNFVDALDLSKEPETVRERYGDSGFGQSCLLARRLLESGVNFVEVSLGGWDTHGDNFNAIRNLSGELDRPWSNLMDDLKSSGLLDETIVIWMGEFGRTPQINAQNGRDHFPNITPVVIGGGGIAGGVAVGKTNANGTEIDGAPYQVADLFATLYSQFGIKPDEEFTTSFDSPTTATDKGKIISELNA
jgi:Protein of unknown function (DUF1501)